MASLGQVVLSSSSSGGVLAQPHRPTYIGIHARDETTRVLYTSSGCFAAIGYTPEFIMQSRAKDFLADHFDPDDYLRLFESSGGTEEEEEEDEANVYVFHVNIRAADGSLVLHRATTFKCDNCIVYIGMTFPDIPYRDRHELTVQMLDGAMKQRNVTRERMELEKSATKSPPVYYNHSKQAKAAFILGLPKCTEAAMQLPRGAKAGPQITFVTGSVSRLVDADTSDLYGFPFLKLVAPEDVLHVGSFFDRLVESTDVLFETFSLLSRPYVISGDIIVRDESNPRVVVECLGASSQDGLAILVRKLRIDPSPKRDTFGNYIRPGVHQMGDDGGYISLSELISSDPDTSDAPDAWSRFN